MISSNGIVCVTLEMNPAKRYNTAQYNVFAQELYLKRFVLSDVHAFEIPQV